MNKLHFFLISFFIIIFSIILSTDLKHHIYTFFQAASRMKTSHNDYKMFPNIIMKGNPYLKDIPRKIIQYDKKKYDFQKQFHAETLMILKDGNIIIEEYFKKNTYKSKFNLYSAVKTLISLAIGILQDRKLLNINDQVSKYLDWSPFKNTTIKNVLEMSSGYADPLIHWYIDMAYDYFAYNITNRCKNYKVDKNIIPGTYFRYSNLNTQILSEIIKKITGIPTYQFIHDNIYINIAKFDGLWSTDRVKNVKYFCCLFINTEDFLRFGKLILDKGKANDKQIISEKYIHDMFIPNNKIIDSENHTENNYFYGLHAWTLTVNKTKVNYFSGLQGQYSFIFSDYNLVVSMFSSDEKSGGRTYNEPMQIKIINQIKEMLNLE